MMIPKLKENGTFFGSFMSLPRLKHFIWRLLRDCLPTRQRLQSKGVSCINLCSYCNTNLENPWHVMFGCKQVESVWETSGLRHIISDHVFRAKTLNQLVFSLLESLNPGQQQKFCMILWCIWYRRNQWIWENLDTHPATAVHLALQFHRE